ncbi:MULTISPECIES: hypothetical protein [unclassified Corallococcus]|uniref:hypothetical protein n=1 Tax=unclassified Corallococcus TaxID=2685029 RepID=UPI001A8E68A4|nr:MULTISPECIES: hypothetical protein [unclassified Corallococcus]MBN9682539.1 hypothetical protein [Corallococcus sp. NCSPR001]WAS85909.1 hypothetical protein O0N60_02820 [Corallococcus sp. NCRR]
MANGRRLVTVGLLGLFSVPAMAGEGVQGRVQEFFLGDGAPPQQRGQVELGTGLEWTRQDDETRFELPVRAEYGLSDRVQLEAKVALTTPEDPRGLDTAEAGIGLALINDSRRGFTLSVGMDLEATRDIRDDRFRPGFEPYLLAYQDVGPVGFNLQLKAEELPGVRGLGSELHPDFAAGAVLALGPLRPMVEAGWRDEDGTSTLLLSPGLLARPLKSLEFGVAVPWRIHAGGARDVGVMGMLTWQGGGA